ncbi:MAG: O-antigen translocase, partial [Muribaculaceae bacterium]|nr:O-antigen translocase [Muribaculaceae bacterium]
MAKSSAKHGGMSQLILKAMGIFGGVQILNILCSVIRTKLVALWIGPVGVGLFGLFNQALEMLNVATNLGVRNSSVRDISQAVERRDRTFICRIVTVVRRWSMWLGWAGAVLTIAMAPLLSRLTFGDFNHVWNYVALSIAVLFMALTNGEYAV